tara:strand:+ start:266 stop:454 length:189 start_codon:yes stop_codon:yes gene_type:complete
MKEDKVKKLASQYLRTITPHILAGNTSEAHRWLSMAIREVAGDSKWAALGVIEEALEKAGET